MVGSVLSLIVATLFVDPPVTEEETLAAESARAAYVQAFSDLAAAADECPRGCGHLGPPADPECALDALTGPAAARVAAARRLLVILNEPTY